MEDEIEPHQFLLAALMISVTPVRAAPKAASPFQHRGGTNSPGLATLCPSVLRPSTEVTTLFQKAKLPEAPSTKTPPSSTFPPSFTV